MSCTASPCKPSSATRTPSGRKGGIENAIGRVRRFIPRKTDLATLPDNRFLALVGAYNNTPRKCEIFSQALHFERESTFPPARA